MTSKKIFPAAALLLLLLIAPEAAYAQSSFGDTASKFFGGMIEIFTVLNWLALAVVQALLNPDFIFGAQLPSGVRPMELILNQIWIVSRDIVNGIFAFMLLAFGVYMIIFGAEKGVGAMLKEKAPKFVLAVVLVNFSWFFPRVILDMANVGQTVIYQLPSLVVGPSTKCISAIEPGPDGVKGTGDDIKKPCNFVWKVRLFPPTANECTEVPAPPGCPRPKPTSPFPLRGQQMLIADIYYTDWEKAAGGKFENGATFPVSGADVVINGLAVNFAKMPQLARVEFERANLVSATHSDLAGKSRAYLKFFVYLAFHAILSMAIGLILLAFAAVLLVRVAVIWMCVAFMPFIFVGYAWKGALGDLGHEKAPNIWTKFIKYALIPVFVAIPLSVGFTLLSFSGYLSNFGALNMAGSIEVAGMEHVITGITEIHELIWMLLTLGIIWTGTFAVLESDEYSAKIVGGIKGVGTTGVDIAKKSLLYAPVIPFPGKGGGTTSVGKMLDTGKRLGSGKGLWDIDDILKPSGGGGAPTPAAVQAAVSDRKDSADFKRAIDGLKTADAGNSAALRESLQKLADALAQSGHISRDQAQHVLTDRSVLREVLEKSEAEKLITGAEKNNLAAKFDRHYASPAGAAAINIGLEFNNNAINSNVDTARKHAAGKAHEELRSGRRSVEDIKTVLQSQKNIHTGQVDQAVAEILLKIEEAENRATTNNTDVTTEVIAALNTLKT